MCKDGTKCPSKIQIPPRNVTYWLGYVPLLSVDQKESHKEKKRVFQQMHFIIESVGFFIRNFLFCWFRLMFRWKVTVAVPLRFFWMWGEFVTRKKETFFPYWSAHFTNPHQLCLLSCFDFFFKREFQILNLILSRVWDGLNLTLLHFSNQIPFLCVRVDLGWAWNVPWMIFFFSGNKMEKMSKRCT